MDSTYITVDKNLNWQQHIMENLKNNCHPTLYDSDLMFTFTLFALRKITNKENILMAIFAFHLQFGSIAWGSVADTLKKSLSYKK